MRARTKLLGAGLVLLGMCALGGRTDAVEFATAKSYTVGTGPIAIATGDFNGDGKADLAVANKGSGNVSILLGNGDGTFQSALNFDVGITAPESIFVGDFNGDGKQDVVVFQSGNSSALTAGAVSVLFGNGDGSFQPAKTTTLTVSAVAITAGDFNGDKKTDLVVVNGDLTTSAVSLQILLGKGDGSFQAAKTLPATGLQNASVAVMDFNKDGKLDLAVSGSGGVLLLHGQGDGTFLQGATAPVAAGFIVTSIKTADLNGDGKADLIVDSREPPPPGCIPAFCLTHWHGSAFLGNGDGTFAGEQVFHSSSGGVQDLVVGDFNGDGTLDIVYLIILRIFNDTTSTLQIRLGKGDGTFAPSIAMANSTPLAAAQDLNGDNLTDLVAVDQANGNVEVLLNDSPGRGTDLGIIGSSASPEPVGVGTSLTYSADVLNEGPQNATGVTLTDALPSNVAFVSTTASQGSCSQAKLVVTCNLGTLADTDDAQVTIVVTPNTAGTIMNTLAVAGTETDSAIANNDAAQNSIVVPVYTLTVTKSGNGNGSIISNSSIDCGIICSETYLSGATANLGDNVDAGSIFQSWGGACSGTPTNQGCSITMDSDKTVTATIVLGVTLNVTVAGGGTGTVTSGDGSITCVSGSCSSLALPGSSISLTAAPSAGSNFGGWSGACTGSDPKSCNIKLSSNQSVTATFGVPPEFSLNPAAKSLTTATGGQVTDVISISEQGGFTSAIQLTCSVAGPAPMPTCSLSPANIPPGANSPTSTLTITAPGKSAYLLLPRVEWRARTAYGLGFVFAILLLFDLFTILSLIRRQSSLRWALRMAGGLAFAAILISLGACGGASSPPPPQTFNVTVTATSGALQHATGVSVTVQKL